MKFFTLISFLAGINLAASYLFSNPIFIRPDNLPTGVIIMVTPTEQTKQMLQPSEIEDKLTSIVQSYEYLVRTQLQNNVKHVYNSAFYGLSVEFTDLLKVDQFIADRLPGHTDIFNQPDIPRYVAQALEKVLKTEEMQKYGIDLVVSPDAVVKIGT